MPAQRRTAVTAAAVAAAVSLAGCGNHTPKAVAPVSSAPVAVATAPAVAAAGPVDGVQAVDLLTAAVHKVDAAGSARISGTITVGTSAGDVTVRMGGLERWAAPYAARLTMSTSGVAGVPAVTEKVIIGSKAMYISSPALSKLSDKPWAELSFAEIHQSLGIDFGALIAQTQQMQPGAYVAMLTSSGNVSLVGTATVGGVTTQHYAGTVDLAKALAALSPALRKSFGKSLATSGLKTFGVDAWVDSAGRPRQVRVVESLPTGTATTVLRISDYGIKVDVTPPAASQTFDLAKLLRAGHSG